MTQNPGDGPPYPEFERAPDAPASSSSPKDSGSPPREAKIAAVLLTVLAVILVFFGVLYISMAVSLANEMRSAIASQEPTGLQITDAQLRMAVRVVGVLMIGLGLGHAASAQGVRNRRSWARPIGYVSSGLILAFSLLSFATGAITIPAMVLALLALGVVLQLSKPALRAYLSRRPSSLR